MAFRFVCLALLAAAAVAGGLFAAQSQQRRTILSVPDPLGAGPAPACDALACPPFRTVHAGANFEIREYREAVWAETEPLLEASFLKAGVEGFHRLFQYIQGRNVQGVHIPMTAPVLTAVKASAGPFGSQAFTVKFFVPPQFSSKPPEPSEGLGVKIASLPRRCVAVRSFPGFATDINIVIEARLLADSLENTPWADISSDRSELYSIAQYNSPFEIVNRVNEVWVAFSSKEGDAGCTPGVTLGPSIV